MSNEETTARVVKKIRTSKGEVVTKTVEDSNRGLRGLQPRAPVLKDTSPRKFQQKLIKQASEYKDMRKYELSTTLRTTITKGTTFHPIDLRGSVKIGDNESYVQSLLTARGGETQWSILANPYETKTRNRNDTETEDNHITNINRAFKLFSDTPTKPLISSMSRRNDREQSGKHALRFAFTSLNEEATGILSGGIPYGGQALIAASLSRKLSKKLTGSYPETSFFEDLKKASPQIGDGGAKKLSELTELKRETRLNTHITVINQAVSLSGDRFEQKYKQLGLLGESPSTKEIRKRLGNYWADTPKNELDRSTYVRRKLGRRGVDVPD